ncbi:MAG: protein kinase [Gemmatimonadales bacterium]
MTDLDRLTTALSDRYRIERELGRGGMATVYLAEDVKHHREVAVKVLHPELGEVLGKERFLREIETAARLSHPHILPLHDSGEIDGFLFFVMPLAEDESLRDRLDREKQLPIEDALRIAREVADALSYAHSHGVVHRDIKPENILLSSGHAVVADFGIARAVSAAGGDKLTETGMAIGTPSYMSPEQAAGEQDIDGRSDLYALGCVLYEMLAGQPPFTGPTTESVIHQHMTAEAMSLTSIRPAVPAEVAGVVQRAMAKTPADRFSPAAQFAEALAAPGRVPAPAPAAAAKRRWLLPVAAAGVLVVAAVVVMSRGGGGGEAITIGAARQVTLDPGLEVDPAISPDGEMIAYAAGSPRNMQIFVRQIGGGRTIQLTDDSTINHRSPRWSANGSDIAYQRSDSVIAVVGALGGPARPLIRFEPDDTEQASYSGIIMGFDWADGESRVVYSLGWPGRIYSQDMDTGERIAITDVGENFSPAISPDGGWVAYVRDNAIFVFGTADFANEAVSSIAISPMDGGPVVAITDGTSLNVSPQWLPDGRTLLWVSDRDGSRDIYQLVLSGSMEPTSEPRRLTTGLDVHTFSVSADGRRLAYTSLASSSNVWAVDLPSDPPGSAREAVPLTRGNQIVEGMDVTQDGGTLVFDSNRGGNYDIYTVAVGEWEPLRLTSDSAPEFSPKFSADGSSIAYHSMRSGNRDLFTMSRDGTGNQRHTSGPEQDLDPDWAPDDSALVFLVFSSVDADQLHILSLSDGSRRSLETRGQFPRWSPRGDLIAFTANEGLHVIPAEGGPRRLLVPSTIPGFGPELVAWHPDGRTIYYLASTPSDWAVWSVIEGGEPQLILEFDDPNRQPTRYGFTTDGRKLYMTLGSHESDVWVLELN